MTLKKRLITILIIALCAGSIYAVGHLGLTVQPQEAGEAANDRTALTLSKAVAADCTVIALETAETVAGMTTDDITALKGVLKQYE